MRAKAVSSFFLACAWALLAAPALALDSNGPTWRPREFITDDVYVPGHFGADRVLEYDHWGNPGVAIDSIYPLGFPPYEWVGYWRRSALGWQSQFVDYRYLYDPNMGMYPSLAYDRYERPSISYYNSMQSPGLQMNFAHWDADNWWVTTFDWDAPPSGKYTCLAYDAYGRPAVAYQTAEPNPYLKYWYDANANYRVELTEPTYACTQYFCGYTPTLAFDKSNRPWIAHLGQQYVPSGPAGFGGADGPGGPNNFDLMLSMEDPGVGWRTAILEANVQNTGLSMAINPRTGQPAVVYQRWDSNLIYEEYDGASWHEQVLTTGATIYEANGCEPSLAFDPGDGHPAVAYVNWWRDLMFTWFDGNAWQTQRVDGSLSFADPSLAFNEYGTGWPGIAYFDYYNGTAYFIEDPQGVPEPASLALVLGGWAILIARARRGKTRREG